MPRKDVTGKYDIVGGHGGSFGESMLDCGTLHASPTAPHPWSNGPHDYPASSLIAADPWTCLTVCHMLKEVTQQ